MSSVSADRMAPRRQMKLNLPRTTSSPWRSQRPPGHTASSFYWAHIAFYGFISIFTSALWLWWSWSSFWDQPASFCLSNDVCKWMRFIDTWAAGEGTWGGLGRQNFNPILHHNSGSYSQNDKCRDTRRAVHRFKFHENVAEFQRVKNGRQSETYLFFFLDQWMNRMNDGVETGEGGSHWRIFIFINI